MCIRCLGLILPIHILKPLTWSLIIWVYLIASNASHACWTYKHLFLWAINLNPFSCTFVHFAIVVFAWCDFTSSSTLINVNPFSCPCLPSCLSGSQTVCRLRLARASHARTLINVNPFSFLCLPACLCHTSGTLIYNILIYNIASYDTYDC